MLKIFVLLCMLSFLNLGTYAYITPGAPLFSDMIGLDKHILGRDRNPSCQFSRRSLWFFISIAHIEV